MNPLSPLNDGSLPRSTCFSELRSNRKFWEQEALLGVLRGVKYFRQKKPAELEVMRDEDNEYGNEDGDGGR